MISHPTMNIDSNMPERTVWGLTPVQLHDRFWAARGVQVVRQGEPSEIVDDAELFLLTDPRSLTVFKLRDLVETLSWLKPDILYVRLKDRREHDYEERVACDEDNRFLRFDRVYASEGTLQARVALTPNRLIARRWQKADSPMAAWRMLREMISRDKRASASIEGSVYDRTSRQELKQFTRDLVWIWKQPSATIKIGKRLGSDVWIDGNAKIPASTRFVGPAWVGAGRELDENVSVVGPAVLWDDPLSKPEINSLQWRDIEPTEVFVQHVLPRSLSSFSRMVKRLFDIVFSLLALIFTLPLYPIIMLAIFIEDGRPFFFGHRRESMGGKEFPCIKFRSMRKDAEAIKAKLLEENQADGPQFFIENDPRLTRVGKIIRKTNIDELPQFFNVLIGQMSIVGPRPSPFKENQFCPAWREARLSVRPGITGLWQIRRSRTEGEDFQEWIKYDIEYVETLSWRLDMWIIKETIGLFTNGIFRRQKS